MHLSKIVRTKSQYFLNYAYGNVITDENWLIEAHFPLLDKLSLGYKRYIPTDIEITKKSTNLLGS